MAYTGSEYSEVKVLVMGLGLHGGGLGAARFLAGRGAEITVTDLRGEDALRPSVETLDRFVRDVRGTPVRYRLGAEHDIRDFSDADFVIKNPAVPPDSPFLQVARRVETDISLFLKHNPARLTAVTGSKGKSFTASAIHFTLREAARAAGKRGRAFLGGNIAVSPLEFLDELTAADDVVLELSSWQLGDLPPGLLKPAVAVITAIMSDHLDRYGSMEPYIADKRVIYRAQDGNDATIAGDDDWGRSFLSETRGRPYSYGTMRDGCSGAFFDTASGACFAIGPIAALGQGDTAQVVPANVAVPGPHQKTNLMAASLALLNLGIPAQVISDCAARFPGIEHRLELFYEADGVRFYNDTAATIPEAAAAAIQALGAPVIVTGGTDKNLDFTPLADALADAKAVILLHGTGSERLASLLKTGNIPFEGPFSSLDKAVGTAIKAAGRGDSVVLSPGCASFEMFLNEFDRGHKWKNAVISALPGGVATNAKY
jgi:UDP-N-acetylmuramoylalanine--D-glutamate ligase